MLTLIDAGIALAVLGAAGAYLWYVYRPGGTGTWARLLTWLRSLLERLLRRADDGPATPPRAAMRPAMRPGPARPAAGAPVTDDGPAPIPANLSPAEVPPAARPFLDWVANFEPAEDTDIHERARKLTAFDLAYSAAVHESAERCIDDIGLDPASLQGFADYAEERAESAHAAMGIHHRFSRFFAEVKDWMASTGRKLPKDGDFLTPDA